MQDLSFPKLFRTSESARDNFLARLFGMFAEEPVRIWCRGDGSQYLDLGRPTIKKPNETRGATLDFTLQSRTTGKVFVAELKCELAFGNYGYLVLNSIAQIKRHVNDNKEAFRRFIDCSINAQSYIVSVSGRPVQIAGSILVWGSVSDEGRQAVIREYGFADVLSVEEIIRELLQNNNEEYKLFLEQRRNWCEELFRGLLDS